MQGLTDHAGWFRDVRGILKLIEDIPGPVSNDDCHHPGLPVPTISATRVVFDYRRIAHALLTAESVASAETILAFGLKLTFKPADALAGDDTMRYIRRAFMPSGLAVDIVAKAAHMAVPDATPPRKAAPRVRAVAA